MYGRIVIPRLHDTTGSTTGLTTVLNEQPLFVQQSTRIVQMLFHTFGSFYFVVSTLHWQFMVQRFGFNWSLLFYTGRFILGQQPCAELAVQENKKKKNVRSTGCQTGLYSHLTTGCIHDTAVCQTGCQTGLATGWMFVYTIQPVNRLSSRLTSCIVYTHFPGCQTGLTTGCIV